MGFDSFNFNNIINFSINDGSKNLTKKEIASLGLERKIQLLFSSFRKNESTIGLLSSILYGDAILPAKSVKFKQNGIEYIEYEAYQDTVGDYFSDRYNYFKNIISQNPIYSFKTEEYKQAIESSIAANKVLLYYKRLNVNRFLNALPNIDTDNNYALDTVLSATGSLAKVFQNLATKERTSVNTIMKKFKTGLKAGEYFRKYLETYLFYTQSNSYFINSLNTFKNAYNNSDNQYSPYILDAINEIEQDLQKKQSLFSDIFKQMLIDAGKATLSVKLKELAKKAPLKYIALRPYLEAFSLFNKTNKLNPN